MARKDPDIREDVSRGENDADNAGKPTPGKNAVNSGEGPHLTEVKNASASGQGSLEKSDENNPDSPPEDLGSSDSV